MPGIAHPTLGGQRYADLIRNTPGLIGYWRLRDSSGTTARDELGLVNGTYIGSPPLAIGTPIGDGAAVKTNGTTHYVTIVKDLSAYSSLSLSFWMWWDAFANNDKLAFEYTPNTNNDNGFLTDPNSGNGRFQVNIGHGSSQAWVDSFTRPTAAAWHHYLVTMNRATPVNVVYVNGVSKSLTTDLHWVGTYGNFANSTLYLMSRGGASLFGAGRMSEFAMFSRILTGGDAASQYNAGAGR